MANLFLTTDEITLEALAVLENSLGFTKTIRRKYDKYFAVSGAKIGDTLRVRKPARYLGVVGQGYQPEAITETYTNVALTTQFQIGMEMSTADLTLKIDEFSDRILKPAIARIANKVDGDGLALATQLNLSVGTPGTAITTPASFFTAQAKLDNNACPDDGDRSAIIDPLTNANLSNGLTSFFNPQSQISATYRRGALGMLANFDFGKDQNVAKQVVGTLGGTPLVNGGNQGGAATQGGTGTVILKGWVAANTLNAGDVFQLASVFAVNPQNYASTGQLLDLVVQSTATASVGGAMTVTFAPGLVTTGAFANCSNLPADNDAVTVYGVAAASFSTISGKTYPVNVAYHPDFATLVCADLYMPQGTDKGSRKSDDQLGLSIRYIRDYDGQTDQLINRLDILYGWSILRPELACRVAAQ